MRASLIAAMTMALLAAACTRQTEKASSSPTSPTVTNSLSPETTPSVQPVTDYSSFTSALEADGFTVREGKPAGGDFFAVPGQTVFIDDVLVSAYEYPDPRTLGDVRSSIGRDGYSVPTRTGGIAVVEWVATPHFYGAGRLLVLYVGDERRTLEALDSVLGPQFAGG